MKTESPLANIDSEFRTVDLILASEAETRGVDAFTLTLIKVEKQLRKLFTHLVFQSKHFSDCDREKLKNMLNAYRGVYFDGLENGFNALCQSSTENLIGASYTPLRGKLKVANAYRNKIFHGQLTNKSLERDDLVDLTNDLRQWCAELAVGAKAELGYDGFARNSFQKSQIPDFATRLKCQFASIDDYKDFIKLHMVRR